MMQIKDYLAYLSAKLSIDVHTYNQCVRRFDRVHLVRLWRVVFKV